MALGEWLSRCRRLLVEAGESRARVYYHWDADGVASAALALRRLPGARLGGPVRIGVYSADGVPAAGGGSVLVLDYGVPGVEYERLAARVEALWAVDHHRVPPPATGPRAYCNPVAAGVAGEAEYPGNSVLVLDILGGGSTLDYELAALGAAGDLAPFIDSGAAHPGLERLRSLAERAGRSIGWLRRAAEAIDSAYRVMDEDCLRRAAMAAAEAGVEAVLGLDCIVEARERARGLLEEVLSRLEGPERLPCGGLLYKLEMDAYVTSAVGRRLAARNPGRLTVLVHVSPRAGVARLYARSPGSAAVERFAEALRRLGFRVAGKESVAVAEAPAGEAGRLAEAARRAASSVC